MSIPHATVIQLVNKGIIIVDNLEEFNNDDIEQITNNLRCPSSGRPSFTFGAKSQKRLLTATNLVKYCSTVGQNISPANF